MDLVKVIERTTNIGQVELVKVIERSTHIGQAELVKVIECSTYIGSVSLIQDLDPPVGHTSHPIKGVPIAALWKFACTTLPQQAAPHRWRITPTTDWSDYSACVSAQLAPWQRELETVDEFQPMVLRAAYQDLVSIISSAVRTSIGYNTSQQRTRRKQILAEPSGEEIWLGRHGGRREINTWRTNGGMD